MIELTSDQQKLVKHYESFDLEDLYNLIGNQADEYLSGPDKQRYVLGTPNVFKRGNRIVEDARQKICEHRQGLEKAGAMIKGNVLDPIAWVSTIIDYIMDLKILAGMPPIAVAMAMGHVCSWSLAKLCSSPAKSVT